MRFNVEPVYTVVDADYVELEVLTRLLVAADDEGREIPLIDNNRFYTGLLSRVEEILRAHQIEFDISWSYDPGFKSPLEITVPTLPGIELRPHQHAATMTLIARGGRGVVNVATGGGKTEIGCAVAKHYGAQTIFVNDRVKHAIQAANRFKKYGIDCGILGGGHRDVDHMVVSAVADTLYTGIKNSDLDVWQLLERTELLMFDECHHLQSNMWTVIGENCPAHRRAGLSASAFEDPNSRCYDDMLLIGQTGEIVCHVPPRWLIDRGFLAEPLIHYTAINTPRPKSMDYSTVYNEGIVENQLRNILIAGYAEILRNYGFKVLILVQRINHGKNLLKLLKDPNVVFSYGGDQMFQWDGDLVEANMSPEELSTRFEHQTAGILIGSTVYDESIDIPSMTALIMAGGGRKYRRTVQRIGRAAHSTNEFVHVFDFWDYQHPYLQKHSRLRLQTYNQLEYKAYNGLTDFVNRTGIRMNPDQVVMDWARRSAA